MPSRDDAAADTVRHEEHLHVHVETVATETVRIEKVVVTEQRTLTIDVRREELRITRTPLTPGDSLLPPVAPRTPPPVVMILREEQPVITMKVVPEGEGDCGCHLPPRASSSRSTHGADDGCLGGRPFVVRAARGRLHLRTARSCTRS